MRRPPARGCERDAVGVGGGRHGGACKSAWRRDAPGAPPPPPGTSPPPPSPLPAARPRHPPPPRRNRGIDQRRQTRGRARAQPGEGPTRPRYFVRGLLLWRPDVRSRPDRFRRTVNRPRNPDEFPEMPRRPRPRPPPAAIFASPKNVLAFNQSGLANLLVNSRSANALQYFARQFELFVHSSKFRLSNGIDCSARALISPARARPGLQFRGKSSAAHADVGREKKIAIAN